MDYNLTRNTSSLDPMTVQHLIMALQTNLIVHDNSCTRLPGALIQTGWSQALLLELAPWHHLKSTKDYNKGQLVAHYDPIRLLVYGWLVQKVQTHLFRRQVQVLHLFQI